jgi:hypothetical protein
LFAEMSSQSSATVWMMLRLSECGKCGQISSPSHAKALFGGQLVG